MAKRRPPPKVIEKPKEIKPDPEALRRKEMILKAIRKLFGNGELYGQTKDD